MAEGERGFRAAPKGREVGSDEVKSTPVCTSIVPEYAVRTPVHVRPQRDKIAVDSS